MNLVLDIKKAVKKRSSIRCLTEREIHRLEDFSRRTDVKVAFEP
jgi:hypothetical protein